MDVYRQTTNSTPGIVYIKHKEMFKKLVLNHFCTRVKTPGKKSEIENTLKETAILNIHNFLLNLGYIFWATFIYVLTERLSPAYNSSIFIQTW